MERRRLRGAALACRAGVAALCCALAVPAVAWSGHALCTWRALGDLPELSTARVRAESLEAFVVAEAPSLEALLGEQERWSREHLAGYAPRPEGLAFHATPAAADTASARTRFLRALRVSPVAPLPLFLQLRPGSAEPATLPWQRVTSLPSGAGARENRFRGLSVGEEVAALDVVATASGEPDYGLDIGLWDDNQATPSMHLGFGRQPFGNPAVDYSSQAPFHMGFFHESAIVFAAAGFLRRTYPEHRIQQFEALARHAFASGHPYWGWRFAGWAMHYVQDLTQPYHARVLPGVSTLRMLAINGLDQIGLPGPKNDAVTLVTNRHTVVENYVFRRLAQAYERGDRDDLLFAALRDTGGDGAHRVFGPTSARDVVTAEAAAAAEALDRQLERSFPARYTSDPTQTLGQDADRMDMYATARAGPQAEHAELAAQLARLMGNLGRHSRALVRAVLAPG
jgi:hypothetical protein